MTNTTNRFEKIEHTNFTIDVLIRVLKINGCNSKKTVIDMLENIDLKQLRELRQDINERINKKESEIK